MKKKFSPSRVAIYIILLIVAFTNFQSKKWQDNNGVINADVRAYYAYLPALFIHHDLKFEHPEVYQQDESTVVWTFDTGKNSRYIKLTTGMAIVYSPFFLVAHALAEPIGFESNGFTPPYKIALLFSSFVFLIIALLFFRKILLRFFNEVVTAITLLVLFLGTNLYFYYTGEMAMSHGYSVAFIALFLYSTMKWFDQPSFKWTFWIGISAGFFTLIRPTDIFYILFFIFYGVNSLKDLQQRMLLFWKERKRIILILLFSFIVFIPQFLYFNYIFNHWLYFSYTGESFFFDHPHLFNIAFSYRNGWLVYSPLMILSLIGFFFLKKIQPSVHWFVWIVFALYYFVLASWWCWWYSGFGNRAMINLYPLLVFPLAALIAFLWEKKIVVKIAFSFVLLLGIILSIFQAYQYNHWMIHYDSMTKEAYWDSFGRTEFSQLFKLYLEEPIFESSIKGEFAVKSIQIDTVFIDKYDFESKNTLLPNELPYLSKKDAFQGENGLLLTEDEYALNQLISIKGINHLYISAWIKNTAGIHFALKNNTGYYALSHDIKERKGDWGKIQLLAEIFPTIKGDSVEFFVWNLERHVFSFDELTIEGLNIKKVIKYD